jgi:hypothetical protein
LKPSWNSLTQCSFFRRPCRKFGNDTGLAHFFKKQAYRLSNSLSTCISDPCPYCPLDSNLSTTFLIYLWFRVRTWWRCTGYSLIVDKLRLIPWRVHRLPERKCFSSWCRDMQMCMLVFYMS